MGAAASLLRLHLQDADRAMLEEEAEAEEKAAKDEEVAELPVGRGVEGALMPLSRKDEEVPRLFQRDRLLARLLVERAMLLEEM